MRPMMLNRAGHRRLAKSSTTTDLLRPATTRPEPKRGWTVESTSSLHLKPGLLKRQSTISGVEQLTKKSVITPTKAMTSSTTDVRQLSRGKSFLALNEGEEYFSRKEMLWGPYPTKKKTQTMGVHHRQKQTVFAVMFHFLQAVFHRLSICTSEDSQGKLAPDMLSPSTGSATRKVLKKQHISQQTQDPLSKMLSGGVFGYISLGLYFSALCYVVFYIIYYSFL